MNPRDLTDRDLEHIFGGEPFVTRPRRHQFQTLAWAADKRRVALWHGIGVGKSLTALYLHHYIWGTRRHLVVCPNSVVDSWLEQVAQHTHLKAIALRGDRAERRRLLAESDADVLVVNYGGLLVLFCEPRTATGRDDKARTRHRLNPQLCREAGMDGLTADECHGLANPRAEQTKVFHELSSHAERVVVMTGTPLSTGEDDLWGQYWCLDGGRTLGANQYAFRRKHFKQDFFGGWHVRPDQRDEILRRVAPVTLRFAREECLDLPPRAYETRRADMTAEQMRLYGEIAGGLEWRLNGVQYPAVDAAQAAHKLSQVAGGFVLVGGEAVRLAENPKMDLLEELVREADDEKVIVFHGYVEEGRLIEGRLAAMKIGCAALRGEVPDAAKADAVRRFREDPACRVLVAHPRSGGVGLNLQCATIAAFYSNGLYGAAVREQAEGRIWREGQTRPVLYVDLELSKSIDERHLHRIHEQAELLAAALDFVRSWRG